MLTLALVQRRRTTDETGHAVGCENKGGREDRGCHKFFSISDSFARCFNTDAVISRDSDLIASARLQNL